MPQKVVEYRQILQDPDMTDSQMMEHIKHMLAAGYSLEEYKWEAGIKHFVFAKYSEPEPTLNLFGLTVGEA